MTLTSFKLFCDLYRQLEHEKTIFIHNCEFSDINELNNRYRLAKSFKGLKLSGYSDMTIIGYEAFFQVFLSHSALERSLKLLGFDKTSQLANVLSPYKPKQVISEIINEDLENRLFKFVYDHLDSEKLLIQFKRIYAGEEHNIFQISASIRHIFAHGYLTANANKIYPPRIKKICKKLSDFTLDFIDSEFTKYFVKNKEKFLIN